MAALFFVKKFLTYLRQIPETERKKDMLSMQHVMVSVMNGHDTDEKSILQQLCSLML